MVSAQRRSRSPRSEVASRSLIARIPVRGVRTSWAKAASAALTTFGAAALLFRFGALPAALTRVFARDFARDLGSRLDDRVVRAERVLAAMFPLEPRLPPAWHGGALGVT